MLLLVLAMADTVSGAAQSGKNAAPHVVVVAMAPVVPTAPAPGASNAAPPSPGSPVQVAVGPAGAIMPASSQAAAPSPGGPDAMQSASPSSAPPSTVPAGAVSLPATGATEVVGEPRDPWVKPNRDIFAFDIALERNVLAPVAHGYNHVVPHVVRYHVTSALFNLGEPLTAVNDLLQLRIKSMGKTVFRFVVNSTFGIAGLFDVAKAEGVPIHISDFGQTLGRYGVKPGPYVMIPLLGPSDVRDGFGRIVDNFADPVEFFIGGITSPEGISLFLLQGIDWRARSDDTLKAVYGATDPYAFTRSAYTQFRAATVSEATGKQVALPDFGAPVGP